MKQENKKCWSCVRFNRYYTKGYCNIKREDVGFCDLHNKILGQDETCPKWAYRPRVRYMRKQMAILSICGMYDKMAVIEQILKEETELNKIKDEKDN